MGGKKRRKGKGSPSSSPIGSPKLESTTPHESAPAPSQNATSLKKEGNELYSAKKFDEALTMYDAALGLANGDDQLRVALLGNRSMCHLQLEDYPSVLRYPLRPS